MLSSWPPAGKRARPVPARSDRGCIYSRRVETPSDRAHVPRFSSPHSSGRGLGKSFLTLAIPTSTRSPFHNSVSTTPQDLFKMVRIVIVSFDSIWNRENRRIAAGAEGRTEHFAHRIGQGPCVNDVGGRKKGRRAGQDDLRNNAWCLGDGCVTMSMGLRPRQKRNHGAALRMDNGSFHHTLRARLSNRSPIVSGLLDVGCCSVGRSLLVVTAPVGAVAIWRNGWDWDG